MKRFILSFLLIITLVCNCSIGVYASDTSGGGYQRGTTDLTGFDTWTIGEKIEFFWDRASIIAYDAFGLILGGVSGGGWDMELYKDIIYGYDCDMYIADNVDSFNEFAASKLGVNTSGELVVGDELIDVMYQCACTYIEEETGWYTLKTIPFSELPTPSSMTHTEFDSVVNYLKSLPSDNVVFIYNIYYTTTNGNYMVFLPFDNTISFVYNSGNVPSETNASYTRMLAYDYDWNSLNNTYMFRYMYDTNNVVQDDFYRIHYHDLDHFGPLSSTYKIRGLYSKNGHSIRVYKSLDDLKMYSVGQRPYYVTEKFVNYDSSVDNSTTITQTEIDNSITYGDVYNYIINNYDNPDGLTEEELRAILEEYLSKIGGGSGSGSGSGDDDDDDGGGGLLDFLSGLGSLGDAILSILGKLIEYVGKAIDLIVNGISGIIEKIPKSITGLMTAAFPFLPEEFFTAIELALILGVVCIVIKIFK